MTLWTVVKASEEALTELEKNKKLPIRHRWSYSVASMPDLDTLTPIDPIDLGIGTEKVLEQLQTEVRERGGFFDWRTWSTKENLRPGTWVVELLFQDGDPIMCGDRPCRYNFSVQP